MSKRATWYSEPPEGELVLDSQERVWRRAHDGWRRVPVSLAVSWHALLADYGPVRVLTPGLQIMAPEIEPGYSAIAGLRCGDRVGPWEVATVESSSPFGTSLTETVTVAYRQADRLVTDPSTLKAGDRVSYLDSLGRRHECVLVEPEGGDRHPYDPDFGTVCDPGDPTRVIHGIYELRIIKESK